MSKLIIRKKKPLKILSPQKIFLTKSQQNVADVFEYIVISNKQIQQAAEACAELVNTYSALIGEVQETMKRAIEVRMRLAEQLREMFKSFSAFNGINVLVQMPRVDRSTVDSADSEVKLQPTRIFVQPNEPHASLKKLPTPKRKQLFPIEIIQRKELGFTLQDEYIRGFTIKSMVGRVFDLFISPNLKGNIPDELLYKTTNIEYGDYRALGIVLRDMVDKLNENNLKLEKQRDRGIKRYIVEGITKYARKPKKSKKVDRTRKTN